MNHPLAARISAAFAAVGVALGAFGAHSLKETLSAYPDGLDIWKTAVFYHLIHAVTMFVLAVTEGSLRAWWLFAGGIILFSGSLYLLVPLQAKKLGMITPFGGVLFIAGWCTLAICCGRKPRSNS